MPLASLFSEKGARAFMKVKLTQLPRDCRRGGNGALLAS